MPAKFVEDLDFFGSLMVASSLLDFFAGDGEGPIRSLLVFDTPSAPVLLSILLLEGDVVGEERALWPRSPSTLPLLAA